MEINEQRWCRPCCWTAQGWRCGACFAHQYLKGQNYAQGLTTACAPSMRTRVLLQGLDQILYPEKYGYKK